MTHYSHHFDDETTTDIRKKESSALIEHMNIKTNIGTLIGATIAILTLLVTILNCYSSLKTDVALVMQEVRELKVQNEKLNDLVMQLYADKRVAKNHDKAGPP